MEYEEGRFEVFGLNEQPDKKTPDKMKTIWIKLGRGFLNKDQSITLLLDAYPVGTKIQVRREPKREARTPSLNDLPSDLFPPGMQ